jgi:uncharacterized protein (TIGR02266 family)
MSAALKLTLQLLRPKDLLERWYPNGRHGGISLEGPLPGALGERCQLSVEFAEPALRTFQLHGRLAWARHKGSQRLRESFGMDMVDDDLDGRERLLRYARDEFPLSATRFAQRLSTNLPVRVVHDGKSFRESLMDLSQGGAFVKTPTPLPVDTQLTCELRPPLSLRGLKLQARVAWVRDSGEHAGMGLEFRYADPRESKRVQDLLDRLARKS